MCIARISQTEQTLILKAQKSTLVDELIELSRNPFSNVRRCVAKNINTPKHIVDMLACDPVSNVVYAALINTKCSIKREMNEFINKCVICPKDESTFRHECVKCNCF